ncbi:hypothetical protein SERLA73DRAFT_109855 [Serpula lacrymans var. lacrymans S7.3]|uniref:Methyltransferase n=2 Tax=Serpula lacrymans var. lacrymans TaxID=341189 RepID=F8PZS1_SERL3|nr:uncharacterized protein SERLADRAFT_470463 [Serpula lacrymans var. lacrymans S7.9]EGN98393.1 hypothetical protein SERLA73DRAFT_109855 [Serpula lacrymans var. lacrymans S7.3]EGO23945.1 hypothetical protein SERLADRAFT_470463 [Serpula lacrymans var. lacrymans S7.9]
MSTTSTLLKYFLPPSDGRRVYTNVNADPVTGKVDRSWVEDDHEAQIENVRGSEGDYTLDNSGFQFFRRPAKHTTFTDDAEIQKEYYPESIELIKELTGASSAVVFDHTIRRRRPGEADDSPQRRQPVSLVHVDQTTASSVARVHRHLPPTDAPALLRRRFQIVNLWRPISHAALDWPLALCDYRSVDAKKDLIPVALIYPDREGEILGIRHNPNHKWKYLKGMEPDEIVLIKCFDSVQDGSVAVMTPHTGFQDPTTPKDAPLRESIELRLLVFYD